MDSIITLIEQLFKNQNPIKKTMRLIERESNSTNLPVVLLQNEQKNDLFTIICIFLNHNNDTINNHYLQWIVHDISGSDLHDGYSTYCSHSGKTIVPWDKNSQLCDGTEIFILLSQRNEHEHYVFRSRYNGLLDLNTSQYTLHDVFVRHNVSKEENKTFAPHWFACIRSLTSRSFNSM